MEIKETPDKPLEIERENTDTDRAYTLEGISVRHLFKAEFDPTALYCFVRTVVNPVAADELRKPHHREPYAKHRKPMYPDEVAVRFTPRVMDSYLDALQHIAKGSGISHFHYPLIASGDVRTEGHHPQEINWPVIHVIKGEDNKEKFKGLVGKLHEDDAWNRIVEKQGQWKYETYELTALRELKIPPLLLQEREWKIAGSELRNAIDFLSAFKYEGSSVGRSYGYDDD